MIIVNGWKPLTIITKRSIMDVAAALDSPLTSPLICRANQWASFYLIGTSGMKEFLVYNQHLKNYFIGNDYELF